MLDSTPDDPAPVDAQATWDICPGTELVRISTAMLPDGSTPSDSCSCMNRISQLTQWLLSEKTNSSFARIISHLINIHL